MYKKTCPSCKGRSYSSAGRGKWICPYCEADLTDVPLRLACALEEGEEESEGKVVRLYEYESRAEKLLI